MKAAITVQISEEQAEKERLSDTIQRKQKEIETFSGKIENLRWQLLEVKKIYMIRIGQLYLTIDQLDIEIGFFRQIEKLMKEGYTYEQAKLKLEEDKKERQRRVNDARQKLDDEVYVIDSKEKLTLEDAGKIKQLYRQLIVKFHPDLVQEPHEKQRRELLMKQINKAYEDNDSAALEKIAENQSVIDYATASLSVLKKKLNECYQAIEMLQKEYKDLLHSEWNVWKRRMVKAKKEKSDAFAELEKNLRETMSMKQTVLSDLRATYEA